MSGWIRVRGCSGLAAAALVACASSGPPQSRFERKFQRYLSLPNQKVMVIAGDPQGSWASGLGFGFSSPGMAQDRAMEQCNVRRKRLGGELPCVVYAVGSEIVWEPQPVSGPAPGTP